MSDSGARRWRMRGLATGLVVLAVAGGTPGCSTDEVGQSPVDAYCSGLCEAAERCHLGDSSCTTYCAERSGAERFSLEGAKHLGECVAGIDCVTLADDAAWNEAFDACWQSSKPLVEVTAHVRSVCAPYVEAWFECGSQLSTRECEKNFGMWSDPLLDQVAGCVGAADCEAFDACVEGVFEPS